MREYTSEVQTLGCPSAPSRAIVVMEELDKPQLRLDRETDKGYAVSVGRIREDESGSLSRSVTTVRSKNSDIFRLILTLF